MNEHFEDIYPGFNTKVTVHEQTPHFETSVEIEIQDTMKNINHLFSITQKTANDKAELLDTNGNIICEFDQQTIKHSLQDVIKTIITTFISSQHVLHDIKMKPFNVHHFENSMHTNTFQGYTPSEIQSAYSVLPTLATSYGATPVITIVIAYHYPGLQNDFDQFCKLYNLPSKKLQIVTLDPLKTENSGWAGEICLDTQWAHAMCPVATIQVVESITNGYQEMFDAVQYASAPPPGSPLVKPNIISCSWGCPEFASQTQFDKYFSDNSIVYVASSGDGNYACYPSSSPNMLSVGGTSLSLNPSNKRIREITWMSAGSGPSTVFNKPSYQQGIQPINKYSKRVLPDLSGVANPSTGVVVVCRGSTRIIGGTSVSAPIVAGILATPLAIRKKLKKTPFTTNNNGKSNNLQQLLYSIYKNQALYSKHFYDVDQGTDGDYSASVGYDAATGLGVMISSAIATTLINAK